MCRRTSGAPYVSWLVVEKGDFKWRMGNPETLASSSHGTRTFCSACGTPLTCVTETHPQIVDVTLGSLDHPESFTPVLEAFTDTKLPWTNHIAELKVYKEPSDQINKG